MNVNRWAVTGGWALTAAGAVGAAAAVFLIVVPPAVGPDAFSFPLTSTGHILAQIAFFLHHLLVVWGLLAFWRAGLAGRGVVAAIGGIGSAGAMAALAVQELVSATASQAAYPSAQTDVIESVYGILTLVTGAALVVLGLAAVRARVLVGVSRLIVLILGIFVFVPLTPAIFGPFALGRVAIGVWLLLFAWLGAVMIQWARATDQPHAFPGNVIQSTRST